MSNAASFDHPEFPRTLSVDIALDDDPRYKGTMHDDAVARAARFKAALVPGAFIYGHVSRLALMAWGPEWARIGAMSTRFRRPVYNGDVLTITAGALASVDGYRRADVSVENEDGEAVAVGWVAMPRSAPQPPAIVDLPILPLPAAPEPVAPGALAVGTATTTNDRDLTRDAVDASLRAFDETHPFYRKDGYVHSGCLMRMAMGDAYSRFKFPQPVVLTECETQHFALVKPGVRVATSGRIVDAFERKGRYYFVSEEHMIADGTTVIARYRRTSLYASEGQA
jgi:acyl dehydratase